MKTVIALLLLASTAGAGQNRGWVVRSVETKSLRPTATKQKAPTLSEAERDHIIAMYNHAVSMTDYASEYGHALHGKQAVKNNLSTLRSMIKRGSSYRSIVQQYEKTRSSYKSWERRHNNQSVAGRNARITRP